jgi:metal-responsive CopG/Arc/MetJ family transcriptional regulator
MASTPRMGRRKIFSNRLTVPISDELLERVDAVLLSDENRLDMIRDAVTREVIRREGTTMVTVSPAQIEEVISLFDEGYQSIETSVDELKSKIASMRKTLDKKSGKLGVK